MKSRMAAAMSPTSKGSSLHATGGPPPEPAEAPFSDREKTAGRIQEALTRLDLILGLLETLNQPLIPFPGDSDLRNGCGRALTSVLGALAEMEPSEASSIPPGPAERALEDQLDEERLSRLIDADRLACLCSLIDRLLP